MGSIFLKFLFGLGVFAAQLAYAHEDHDEKQAVHPDHTRFEREQALEALSLFKDWLELKVLDEHSKAPPMFTPILRLGWSRYVVADDDLWRYVRAVVSYQRRDILHACHDHHHHHGEGHNHDDICNLPSEDVFFSEVKDRINKKWIERRLYDPIKGKTREILTEAAFNSGRLGKDIFYFIVAFEVAETALSIAKGGMGAHFVCSAAQAAALFKQSLIAPFRTASAVCELRSDSFWADPPGVLNPLGLTRAARNTAIWLNSTFVFRGVRKSLRRARFWVNVPDRELSQELLAEVDEDGPKPKLMGFIPLWKDGKRAQFVKNVDAKIQNLKQRLALEPKTKVGRYLNERKVRKLRRQIEKLTKLERHIYFGHRSWYYLKLGRRTFAHSRNLTRSGKENEAGLDSSLWIVSAQENLFHSVYPQGESEEEPILVSEESQSHPSQPAESETAKIEPDSELSMNSKNQDSFSDIEIFEELARNSFPKFSEHQISEMAKIGQSVYQRFSPNLSTRERALGARFIEDLFIERFFETLKKGTAVFNPYINFAVATYGQYVYQYADSLNALAQMKPRGGRLYQKERLDAVVGYFEIHAHLIQITNVLRASLGEDADSKKTLSQIEALNEKLFQRALWMGFPSLHTKKLGYPKCIDI